jgi:hypothetical protein
MPDYSKAYIYGLSIDGVEIYVGSSYRNNNQRKNEHKKLSKAHPSKLYAYIRDHGGWDAVKFDVLEEYPCENKIQLLSREGLYIQRLQPVCNTRIAGRKLTTPLKEYWAQNARKYYHAHKEKEAQRSREYYQANRERILEKARIHYEMKKNNNKNKI